MGAGDKMKMIKGRWELDSGIQAKVYEDENGEIMVKLIIPSFTSILLPFDELRNFVDTVDLEFGNV